MHYKLHPKTVHQLDSLILHATMWILSYYEDEKGTLLDTNDKFH